MKRERFEGVILLGHKEAAVEVPFDPARQWSTAAIALRHGRRGYPVRGSLKGVRFESCIVPRSKRFWLLLDDALLKSARASECDKVSIEIEPSSTVGYVPRAGKKTAGAKKKSSVRKSARSR